MAQLDLFVSPPGTGKTTHCIDLFRQEVSKSGGGIESSSYFILPSREHAERIQNLVLKKGVPGLFNAHILSMNDLAQHLLRGNSTANPTDTIRRIILKRILETSVNGTVEFSYFKAVRNFSGFHELLTDAVKEFSSNMISVDEFEKRAQPLLRDPVFRSKFRDFCVVLKNYELELEKLGLEEPEKNIARLSPTDDEVERLDLVIFDGFYHFTRAQKFLIERICNRSHRVVVTLTLPDRQDEKKYLFEYPERTRNFLEKAGFKERGGAFKKSHRVLDRALQHLEKNIFLENPAVFNGEASSIKRLEACSARVEVEMVAREIRRLYRETSCHYSDICLVLRSVGPYEKMIRSVFSEFDVPTHIHERYQLIQNGPVQTLYRFFELMRNGWQREDLFYLLKSSFFSSRVDLEDVLLFENAAFRENISSGDEAWKKLGSAAEISSRVLNFLNFLGGLQSAFLECSDVRQFSRRIEEFLRALDFTPTEGEKAEEDTQALACLKAILQASRRYYESSEKRLFEPTAFLFEMRESIERALFSVTPKEKNLVQVYDVVMALPKEFKIVFILGLLEKNFPQNVIEDPLFKDRQRQILNRGEVFLEERLWRVAGERYFFYMSLTRAKEKLYLSYPAYGNDAKPTLPSFYLNEVERCFEPGSIQVFRKDPDQFLPNKEEWGTQAEVVRGIGEIFFASEIACASPAPNELFPLINQKRKSQELKNILEFGLKSDSAVIEDAKTLAEFSRIRNVFSATRLETYQTCAFRYFASKILCLNEPVRGREAMFMGTMLHDTLEGYFNSLTADEKKNGQYLREPAAMQRSLWQILETQMQKGIFRNEPGYRQNIYLNSMRETLAAFVRHECELGLSRGLVPTYFELGFGKDVRGTLDYLEIKDESSLIKITGKIDRIDLSRDGREALVIDYKRSQREHSIKKKLDKGLELQLPVYLLVAKRLLGLKLLGAELRILRTRGREGIYPEEAGELMDIPKGQRRTLSEFEGMLTQAESRIRSAVRRLKSADISVYSKSCNFCEFDPVCRFEKWKLVYNHD